MAAEDFRKDGLKVIYITVGNMIPGEQFLAEVVRAHLAFSFLSPSIFTSFSILLYVSTTRTEISACNPTKSCYFLPPRKQLLKQGHLRFDDAMATRITKIAKTIGILTKLIGCYRARQRNC